MHYAMETYGGVDIQIHVFFILVSVRGEWSASRLSCFITRERAPLFSFDRQLGGHYNRSGRLVGNILRYRETNSYPSAAQPLASLCTHCPTEARKAGTPSEIIKKTPWSESASELYRPSNRRFSAK
jgi:hypothetical protein